MAGGQSADLFYLAVLQNYLCHFVTTKPLIRATITMTRRSNQANRIVVTRGFRPVRTGRRQNDPAMKMLRSSTTRVNGPIDPTNVEDSVILTKQVQLNTGTGSADITPAKLAAALPGGAAVWKTLRLVKLSVYGLDTGQVTLTFSALAGGDEAVFTDAGTPGNRRCQIHVSPTFTQRNTWLDGAATTILATVSNTTTGVVIATIEARAPGTAPTV